MFKQICKDMKEIARMIIQGGMGVGVSGWRLARASAMAGAIGTVSGTAVANLLANALQKGDKGGHYRRALASFPFPKIAQDVLDAYYIPGGIKKGKKPKEIPMWSFKPVRMLHSLTICAGYSIVWLAKEGHKNPIFINLLEKIQLPHIDTLLGAMLAGVDGVVMGAGLPRNIPKVMDDILNGGESISYPILVKDHPDKTVLISLNTVEFFGAPLPGMIRPLFLPIVTSPTIAIKMMEWCPGKIDGFIVEMSSAGGHNAPPRGKLQLDGIGQPIYGPRDEVDFGEFRKLGVPFWLAGSFASPAGLLKAQALGAFGVQAGTVFALSKESGIISKLKRKALKLIFRREASIYTSPIASPTGYPFKILKMIGTIFQEILYNARKRNCSLGYLRDAVWLNEKIVFRCAAEPVEDFLRKGGYPETTVGCICVCAGLCATIGIRDWELPLITLGDGVDCVRECITRKRRWWRRYGMYSAKDAVNYIWGK